MAIQNFFTSRDNNIDGNAYTGQLDRLWYNPNTNSIFVSDGITVGGIPVSLATGADIIANTITLKTITSTTGTVDVVGNLDISGNISPASNTKIGGISAGPGVVISNEGQLTIDTANLPLSFGNFTANNNILSIVNVDENMILQTEGNAEIQLIGNVGFYHPDGMPPNVVNRFAFFNSDGQVTFYVPEADPLSGAVKIVGSASGNFSPPVNTGVMLQITGQNNDASRLYNDSIGSFSAFVGRRINGFVTAPTSVLAGDEIIRISSTGYDGVQIPGSGTARIVFQAIENYTPTAKGSNLSFWATAVGTNTLSKIATIDAANGVSATKFTTAGNVDAAGNVSSGNLILAGGGIISSTGTITTTANIAGGNLSVTGNISAGNVNAYLTLPAGTTSKAPLVFTAGTLPPTPVLGAMNYDGRVFYAVPQDSERGLIRTAQTYVLNGNLSLVDQTAVQSMFGVSTSVSDNTRYGYSILATIYKTTNNITLGYAIDGNATLSRHTFQTLTTAGASLGTLGTPSYYKNILNNTFTTPVVVTPSLNGAGYYTIQVTGIINVTTGGTWNPLVAFSGLPGTSYTAVGSSVEIWPLGPGNATVSIGNWT